MAEATPGIDALKGIAAFLPRFKAEGFRFGRWINPDADESGVLSLPYYLLSEEAETFVRAASELGWVRSDIDWMRWSRSAEAQTLQNDPGALAQASAEQLSHLLTTVIRQERFAEGTLAAAYESGLLARILERAAALAG